MALLDSEVRRIRYELGYNVLSVGAEPYVGVSQLFEQVIQPYLTAGAATTSNTAASASSVPTPVALALADATGVHPGDVIIVDVDARQERATVQSVSGSNATALLSKVHSGTYPVTVEGGESIIRSILRKLQAIGGLGSDGGAFDDVLAGAGVKKVDEIEFFGGGAGEGSSMEQTIALRDYWRDELANALGVERLNGGSGGGGGSTISVY